MRVASPARTPAHFQGRSHGAQPQQQVLRLSAGEHRILVRQSTPRPRSRRCSCRRTRRRFLACAHQHRHIARAQPLQRLPVCAKPTWASLSHCTICSAQAAAMCWRSASLTGDGCRCHSCASYHHICKAGNASPWLQQHFAAPMCMHRVKRQGVAHLAVFRLAEHEGALARRAAQPAQTIGSLPAPAPAWSGS